MNPFKRIITQVGEESFNQIKNKKVLIVGLGGVGGYAIEALIRSGIHHLILIDYDHVEITNINRQLIATHKTIHESKPSAWQNRIHDINPSAKVELEHIYLDKLNINLLNKYQIDYIIDACDSLIAKEALIEYSQKNNIKLIASMGMGNKLDPSKVKITKLSKTTYDPLARKLRKFVKDNKLKDISVVASTEAPLNKTKEFVTSNSFIPAISGIYLASYIINDICQ